MLSKKILYKMAAAVCAAALLTGCGKEEILTAEVKDASEDTKNINAAVTEKLNFGDEREREFAERGFIRAPETLEIFNSNGATVWSQDIYDFVRGADAPDSANPSLWRNTQLNALYGLYEVVDGIYQVRGYDVANVTFVKGDKGWIVFDCGTGVETAVAAMELFKEEFGDVRISAVVISHAHIDHYGGSV